MITTFVRHMLWSLAGPCLLASAHCCVFVPRSCCIMRVRQGCSDAHLADVTSERAVVQALNHPGIQHAVLAGGKGHVVPCRQAGTRAELWCCTLTRLGLSERYA